MSKLTEEIRKQGLYCETCNKPMETTAISEKEAQQILKLIKGVFIQAIDELMPALPDQGFDTYLKHSDVVKTIEDVQ